MDSLFAGGLPIGEGTKLLTLDSPNVCCGARDVLAWYLPQSNVIKAQCVKCSAKRNLPHNLYSHHFDAMIKISKKRKRGHDDPDFRVKSGMAIFERDGYCCVYCETNERARGKRAEIISGIQQPKMQPNLSLEFPEPFVRDALQMTQLPPNFAYEFFGLVPDHVIPRSMTKKIRTKLSDAEIQA